MVGSTVVRVVLAVGVLAVSFVSREAEACSGPSGTLSLIDFHPRDAATNVPLNAQLFLTYSGNASAEQKVAARDVVLKAQGGAEVALTAQELAGANRLVLQVVLKPGAELSPNTLYEVRSRVSASGCIDCSAESPELIATFTTGTTRDETAPTFAGLTGVDLQDEESCGDSGCCGPYEGRWTSLQFTEPTDPNLVGLRIYRDSTSNAPLTIRGRRGFIVCGGNVTSTSLYGDFVLSPGSYFVRAIDLAGNEDGNTVSMQLACEEPVKAGCAAVPGLVPGGLLLVALGLRAALVRRSVDVGADR